MLLLMKKMSIYDVSYLTWNDHDSMEDESCVVIHCSSVEAQYMLVVVVAMLELLYKQCCYLQRIAISTASSSWLAFPVRHVMMMIVPSMVDFHDDDDDVYLVWVTPMTCDK